MNKKKLIYVCNAFEDETRLERGITTDSPAASKKIFQISQSLKKTGCNVTVISLGRGRSEKKKFFYGLKLKRNDDFFIIYLPFSNIPFFSELLTFDTVPPSLLFAPSCNAREGVYYFRLLPFYIPK